MQPIIKRIQDNVIGKKNLIAYALNDAINRNDDHLAIISDIKDMATDNYTMVREILGKPLLTDIINYRHE